MKKIVVFILIIIVLTSCSGVQNEELIQTSVAKTVGAQKIVPTIVPTLEIRPTNTPRPTSTQGPTNTPRPTATPTIKPTEGIANAIAKNYVVSDEDNGVMIEVSRILIAQKEEVPADFSGIDIFDDKPTIIEFVFRIVNNTDKVVKASLPSSGIASVNGEQINFSDYMWESGIWIGDSLSGDILPGSMVIGGVYTGIKRSTWDTVEKIVLSLPAFYNTDYRDVTKEFLLTIDVVDWTFEPFPDELQ